MIVQSIVLGFPSKVSFEKRPEAFVVHDSDVCFDDQFESVPEEMRLELVPRKREPVGLHPRLW